jgi:hypothetical protein
MASNAELVNLSDEDKKNLMREHQQKKWSLEILGFDVPMWILVLVILAGIYLLHTYGYLTGVETKVVEFSEGTRRMLDNVKTKSTATFARLTSPTSPMESVSVPTAVGTAASVAAGPASEEVKAQLRALFRGF